MISKSTNIGRGRGKELEEDVEEENVGEKCGVFSKKMLHQHKSHIS